MGQDGEDGQSGDQEVIDREAQFLEDIQADAKYERGLIAKEIWVVLILVALIIIREVLLRAWVISLF